jgi:hypothetical protein
MAKAGEIDDSTLLLLLGGAAVFFLVVAGGAYFVVRKSASDLLGAAGGATEAVVTTLGGAGEAVLEAPASALDAVAASGESAGQAFFGTEELGPGEYTAADMAERVEAAHEIEESRQSNSNYGSVMGVDGAWFHTKGDSCYVMQSSSAGSNTTRFFTGPHCRQARQQGLIQ